MVAPETSERKARATGAQDIIEGTMTSFESRERQKLREVGELMKEKRKEGDVAETDGHGRRKVHSKLRQQ